MLLDKMEDEGITNQNEKMENRMTKIKNKK